MKKQIQNSHIIYINKKTVNEKNNVIKIVTKPKVGWGGGGGRGREAIHIEKRRVSFRYFIVDRRISLLSAKFMAW